MCLGGSRLGTDGCAWLRARHAHSRAGTGCLSLPHPLSLLSPASFFGDGFVEMPLADASRTVRLRLQLYTSQQNGLLFLAAGQPDHLLLQLRDGTLQVRTHWAGVCGAPSRMKGQHLEAGAHGARCKRGLPRPLPGDAELKRRVDTGLGLSETQGPAGEALHHYIEWCWGASWRHPDTSTPWSDMVQSTPGVQGVSEKKG